MAYVGTPLDTTNAFQSLAGKRFSGDGSTTDFTLDSSPNSTLDIEVFVGNVRQDPNSAYTVSGTTLAFTGAPPSGTNNIYVVHQAKAVGTIGIPDDTVNSQTDIGGAIADADLFLIDDGAGGTLRKTAASRIKTYAATALDDITTGDAASTLATSAGNITIDAQGNDTDIIFKGTDGGADTTFLTIDGSAAGASAFNSYITSTAIYGKGDDNTGIQFEGSDLITIHTGGNERMRLASTGNVSIGSTGSPQKLFVYGSHDTDNGLVKIQTSDTSANDDMIIFYDGDGTEGGSISLNASSNSVAYNTSSDYRLKENETAITDGITRIKQLKPYRFNWKSEPSGDKVDGFFAHEVSSIVPEAILGEKDAVDGEGNIKNQKIDQSKLVPLLTSALQEAITKIETLETKVKTLEDA